MIGNCCSITDIGKMMTEMSKTHQHNETIHKMLKKEFKKIREKDTLNGLKL
jgi:hypothetical protein